MYELKIPEMELWDENEEIIIPIKKQTIQLEHSLISLRKWESKYHRPFLNDNEKTKEEIIDYIRFMTLTKNVNPIVYEYIPINEFEKITEYIKDPYTATTFSKLQDDQNKGKKKEVITAEIIYWWMIALNIPIEFEKWHLNQLTTLVKVVNIKNSPKKKMDPKAAAMERARLNKERRAKMKTKG